MAEMTNANSQKAKSESERMTLTQHKRNANTAQDTKLYTDMTFDDARTLNPHPLPTKDIKAW